MIRKEKKKRIKLVTHDHNDKQHMMTEFNTKRKRISWPESRNNTWSEGQVTHDLIKGQEGEVTHDLQEITNDQEGGVSEHQKRERGVIKTVTKNNIRKEQTLQALYDISLIPATMVISITDTEGS